MNVSVAAFMSLLLVVRLLEELFMRSLLTTEHKMVLHMDA